MSAGAGADADAAGNVHFEPDRGRPAASMLVLGGVVQSSIDPGDPTYVGLPSARRCADVLDLVARPGQALRVVHLGGGALALPRYLAATRPGSESIVFELHLGVLAAARWLLGDPPAGVDVRQGDARAGLEGCADAWADVVVNDAHVGDTAPAHLGTAELLAHARRVLRPDGCYLNNVIDEPPLALARARLATALPVFAEVIALCSPGVLERERRGNLVLVAADRALPVAELRARAAAEQPAWSVADRAAVAELAAGAAVLHDA